LLKTGAAVNKPNFIIHLPRRGAYDGVLLAVYVAICCLLFVLPQTPLRTLFHLVVIPAFLLLAPTAYLRAVWQSSVWRLTLIFMTWLWLTLFWSQDVKWYVFFEQGGRVFAVLFFVTVTAQLFLRRPDFLRRLFQGLLLVSLITSAAAILWQVWNGNFLDERFQASGRAVSQTYGAAMFGAIIIGSFYALRPLASGTMQRVALWAAMGFLVGFMELSGSRGPLGALIVVGLTAAMCRGPRSSARFLLPAAGLTVAGAAILESIRPGFFLARGNSYRLEIWRQAWDLIKQVPLFGRGLGTKAEFIMQDGNVYNHPHNLFLANQLNGGVVASVLFLALLGLTFRMAWRERRREGMLIGLLLLFTLCCGMVDFHIIPTAINPEYLYFWLPVGLACALQARKNSESLT